MADIDLPDDTSKTAVHLAGYHGEAECLKVLVEQGCDLNRCDCNGMTAAHLAAINDHDDALRYVHMEKIVLVFSSKSQVQFSLFH